MLQTEDGVFRIVELINSNPKERDAVIKVVREGYQDMSAELVVRITEKRDLIKDWDKVEPLLAA
jgi:hypothetical protein